MRLKNSSQQIVVLPFFKLKYISLLDPGVYLTLLLSYFAESQSCVFTVKKIMKNSNIFLTEKYMDRKILFFNHLAQKKFRLKRVTKGILPPNHELLHGSNFKIHKGSLWISFCFSVAITVNWKINIIWKIYSGRVHQIAKR